MNSPVSPPIVPVLDARESAEWDSISLAAGVPSRVLMESAGRAAAAVVGRELSDRLPSGVLVAAGHGNNGGDGWVLARALRSQGVEVWVADQERERSPDCEANRALALSAEVRRIGPEEDWPRAGLAVDALLGTGATGEPRGQIGEMAERVGKAGAPIVALDGPTGLDLSTGEAHGPIRADLTVTFGGLRRGHLLARDWCGVVAVVEMGFVPAKSEWPVFVDDRWAAQRLPPLRSDMHKGERGRVLIVGGQDGMAGAVRHAARGAFAAGAGLVKLAAQPGTIAALQESLSDAMTLPSDLGPNLEPEVAEALAWADAVVLGPGLGRGAERQAFVSAILGDEGAGGDAERRAALVIDADALQVGAERLRAGSAPRVLTPHLGEFKAAFPEHGHLAASDRFAAARAAACLSPESAPPFVLLLKGVPTVVAARSGGVAAVGSGNPALATGGSGDVLAGFISALLAQGLDPHAAAGVGAHLLGRAAEYAARDGSVRTTRPDDVLAAVPEAWRRLHKLTPPQPPVLLRLEPPAVE